MTPKTRVDGTMLQHRFCQLFLVGFVSPLQRVPKLLRDKIACPGVVYHSHLFASIQLYRASTWQLDRRVPERLHLSREVLGRVLPTVVQIDPMPYCSEKAEDYLETKRCRKCKFFVISPLGRPRVFYCLEVFLDNLRLFGH